MFLIKCFQITLYERFQTRRRSLYIINNTFEPLRCLSGKESTCQCRRLKSCRFNPWVGQIPWRRKWQPTPVLFPEKCHGQRSLVGYIHGVTKSWTRLNDFTADKKLGLPWWGGFAPGWISPRSNSEACGPLLEVGVWAEHTWPTLEAGCA